MPHRGSGPLRELFAISLQALLLRPLRTALSALAVAVGIAALVGMISVAEGGREQTLRQLEVFGANAVIVRSRPLDRLRTEGITPRLTAADAEHIRRLVPVVSAAAPVIYRFATASGPSGAANVTVIASTEAMSTVRPIRLAHGRALTAADRDGRRVCILGAQVADTLLGHGRGAQTSVRIDGEWFEVVGVLQPSDAPTIEGGEQYAANQDAVVIVPIAGLVGARSHAVQPVTQIWLSFLPGVASEDVTSSIAHAMERLHRGVADVEVVLPQDLLAQRRQSQRVFNVVVGSIATLALLVGGLGITNVLLASVIERTPEIGLRRVVGATRNWVVAQFLVESLLTTILGGMMGVIGGVFASMAIASYAAWPTQLSAVTFAAALTSATLIGIGSGLYPAVRAARLQPIDAVRYE